MEIHLFIEGDEMIDPKVESCDWGGWKTIFL